MELDQILERLERPRRRQPTHEMVASVLREAIITGHLRGNEPLPQDEIAAQLRVSHIPVREALRQLESEGLVTYQPNRGATVSALTSEEIRAALAFAADDRDREDNAFTPGDRL